MDDHREFVTYAPDTRTAICSRCHILIDFNRGVEKINGDKMANHSFKEYITGVEVKRWNNDDRLDVFEEFFRCI